MSKFFKKNRILVLLTIVLAIAAIAILMSRSKSTLQGSDRDFAVEDTASVTKIFLAKKDSNQVLLSRGESGKWMVNDQMKASEAAVGILLETLKKIDIKRPVARSEHNSVVKRLSSIGVKVEVYQQKPLFRIFGVDLFTKERKTKVFYVGDATQNNMGTYMVKQDADIPFVVYIPGFRGFLSPRFKAKPGDWRDHTIIAKNINQIKSVEVIHKENPAQSFRLEKPDRQSFKIIKLQSDSLVEPFDTLKVLDFLSSFYSVKFEDLLNDFSKKDSILTSTPFHIIRLTDISGETTEIKTYHRKAPEGLLNIYGEELKYDPDRLYASFNDDQDFALIQFYVFDNLTKTADYFRPFRPTHMP